MRRTVMPGSGSEALCLSLH